VDERSLVDRWREVVELINGHAETLGDAALAIEPCRRRQTWCTTHVMPW